LRFVKERSAHAEFDMGGGHPGRGFYLCPSKACFEAAFTNKKMRAAFFRKQDDIRETIREIQETILRSIEKDLILCKKMGYLHDARNEENSPGEKAIFLAVEGCQPEEFGEMQTAARSSKARFYLLPAASDSQIGSCAVGKGFPMVTQLTMKLRKYEMLSSKGPAL
jgi:predicted RNA-binding protein YlxR (DUF448 family)